MTYKDSYLWRLRQAVGSDLVLMPGAMVAVQREDQLVLLTRRSDDGTWCLPAGAAEPGGSFARTAIDELTEETGIEISERDLFPFGVSPRPRRTRSATRTAMSLFTLPCCVSGEGPDRAMIESLVAVRYARVRFRGFRVPASRSPFGVEFCSCQTAAAEPFWAEARVTRWRSAASSLPARTSCQMLHAAMKSLNVASRMPARLASRISARVG